jgi:DUF177 domain-containing protein
MATSPLVVNAAELLRQPGSRRHVSATVAPADVDAVDPSIVRDVTVEVDVDSTVDDVIVSGGIDVPWHGACRRCLRPLDEVLHVEVDERYTDAPTADDDAFEIEHGQIDLAAMVREEVLLAVAEERLCRPDCPGLCPRCGQDLSHEPCGCDTTERDERWAALDQLRE